MGIVLAKWIFKKLRARQIVTLFIHWGEREKKQKNKWCFKSLNISLSKTMISYEKVHFQSIGTLRSFINNILPKLKINFLLKHISKKSELKEGKKERVGGGNGHLIFREFPVVIKIHFLE